MPEPFLAGGLGMYPTLLGGLALLAASLRYAARAESRDVPLMVCLGLFTLLAGALGFVSGLMNVFKVVAMTDMDTRIVFAGTQEAAYNLLLALIMTTLSALVASVGAWRASQRAPQPAAMLS